MNSSGFWKRLRFYLGLPEVKRFWLFLPLFLVLLVIVGLNLEAWLAALAVGLLILVVAFVFLSAAWTGSANFSAKQERTELGSILRSLQDALLAYDQNFQITFFNPAAEALFGLKAEKVIGEKARPQWVERSETKLLAQVIFPSLAPMLAIRSKSGEYPQIAELSFTEPMLELRIATSPVVDESGHLLGFMKMIRDRTREVGLIRSKNEFITVASHQLRTPITEVNWALEALSQDAGLAPENQEIAKSAVLSAHKLKNIVEDLLNVSRIEEGRFGYAFQPTDLTGFLGKLLEEALPQIQRSGLKLYFDRPQEALSPVMLDAQKLSMVFANLLDNATRYNVQNGAVTVGVKKAQDRSFLEVTIKDTGIGIPPEQQEKLFSKFFRADNAVKSQADGCG